MKEKKTKNVLLDVNKAYISIYALLVLPTILLLSSVYVFSIENELKGKKFDKSLHLCELYTIRYVKTDLYNYEEENESISYKDYLITLEYEDITCYITIEKNNQIVLRSILEWDDIENVVADYSYI